MINHSVPGRLAKSKSGFTLIELLVVIAVIGILAALLLSVTNRAKEQSRIAVCQNNLHQIDMGLRMYVDDSIDRLPGGQTNQVVFGVYKQFMKSYLGLHGESSARDKIFACPADQWCYTNYDGPPIRQGAHELPLWDFSSYGFNGANYHPMLTNDFATNFHGIAGRKLSEIKDPARTVMVAELAAFAPFSWHHPSRESDYINESHFNNARGMVGFVDGHVKYIKMYCDTKNATFAHNEAFHYEPPANYEYKWTGD